MAPTTSQVIRTPRLVATLSAMLVVMSTWATSAARAQSVRAPDSLISFFSNLIAERDSVAKRADTAAFRRLLDPDVSYLNDDGARESADQHVRNILNRGDELAQSRWVRDSLRVQVIGDLAFTDSWVVQHRRAGGRDRTFSYRNSDTYRRKGGTWRLFRHTETHAISSPIPQVVNTSVLEEYVGSYEWWPGYVDVISRRGDRLFNQASGDQATTLNRAATTEAFYVRGDPSLIIFIRDTTGRVVGYIDHEPDGQVLKARKLP